jgi:hypothetical protein
MEEIIKLANQMQDATKAAEESITKLKNEVQEWKSRYEEAAKDIKELEIIESAYDLTLRKWIYSHKKGERPAPKGLNEDWDGAFNALVRRHERRRTRREQLTVTGVGAGSIASPIACANPSAGVPVASANSFADLAAAHAATTTALSAVAWANPWARAAENCAKIRVDSAAGAGPAKRQRVD